MSWRYGAAGGAVKSGSALLCAPAPLPLRLRAQNGLYAPSMRETGEGSNHPIPQRCRWKVNAKESCRLSNNFSRLTYKFSRVFEPLKAENRPVPTHIFSVEQAAPFSRNQGCANSPFHHETKIYGSGHNTIRKAHLHDDMKNYGSETETMCPFSGKPQDTTTTIMLHRKVMWQDHKSHMVLTR